MRLDLLVLCMVVRGQTAEERLGESIRHAIEEGVVEEMDAVVEKATEDAKNKIKSNVNHLLHRDDPEDAEEPPRGSFLGKVGACVGVAVVAVLVVCLILKIGEYWRRLKRCSE